MLMLCPLFRWVHLHRTAEKVSNSECVRPSALGDIMGCGKKKGKGGKGRGK